jgi:DNA damage-binding protein 1
LTLSQNQAKVADFEVKGTVFSIDTVAGNLVIAVNNIVSVYLCSHPNLANHDLHFTTSKELTHNGHILALYIKTRGNYVLVGDVLRSMSLLVFNPDERRLVECGRDFNANYMRAVEILGR